MRTKKVQVMPTSATGSTALPVFVAVTLSRAPWDTEPDVVPPMTQSYPQVSQGARHLGPYKKRVSVA